MLLHQIDDALSRLNVDCDTHTVWPREVSAVLLQAY